MTDPVQLQTQLGQLFAGLSGGAEFGDANEFLNSYWYPANPDLHNVGRYAGQPQTGGGAGVGTSPATASPGASVPSTQPAVDTYVSAPPNGAQWDLTYPVGSEAATNPPENVGGFYHAPITDDAIITFHNADGTVRQMNGKEFKETFNAILNGTNAEQADITKKALDAHGITVKADGSWEMVTSGRNAGSGAPGAGVPGGNNPLDPTQGQVANTFPPTTPGGGPAGLAALMTPALFGSAGQLATVLPFVPGIGANAGGFVMGGTMGALSAVARFAGLPGLSLQLTHQMHSYAREIKNDSMIAMCQNPNIPIEDLILLFAAYMADNYEGRLREKLEEAAMAERKENRRERAQRYGAMVGGFMSAVPFIGDSGAEAFKAWVMERNRIQESMDGSVESTTIAMQKVQIIMQKWKQLTELLSNLSKNVHEMSMVPIRAVRG